MKLGETIRIDVESPEEDLQEYAIPVNNGQSYELRKESYDGSWFITWGDLLSGSSNAPNSYNEWAIRRGEQDDIESETPPDNRASLFYVVRDGRQGSAIWWFNIEVES